MQIWKGLTEYKKFRDEVGFHADLALEGGEGFSLSFGPPDTGIELTKVCPEGKVWKIHLEIAVETFAEE